MEGWVGGTGAAEAVNEEREVIKGLPVPQAGSEHQSLRTCVVTCVCPPPKDDFHSLSQSKVQKSAWVWVVLPAEPSGQTQPHCSTAGHWCQSWQGVSCTPGEQRCHGQALQ